MTEKEKYELWVKEQTQKGLVDVNVFVNPFLNKSNITDEQLYCELNSMNEAAASNVNITNEVF